MTPAERRVYKTTWAREDRAKNLPRYIDYKQAWRAKRKAENPEAYLAQEAARMREYFKDPVRLAKKNAAQREAYKLRGPIVRSDPATWRVAIINALQQRAKKKGIPFDLKAEDLDVPTHCPVLGTPFLFGRGKQNMDGPSVDRVIPEIGYVKGNVQVISLRANILKSNCTDPETFRRIALYIEKTQAFQ